MALITLLEYKDYKDIKTPNADLKLEPLIEFVNTFIETYCDVKFASTVVTGALVTSDNGVDFLVPNIPLISVEKVSVNGVELLATQYTVDTDVGVVESTTYFPYTRNAIEVDYTYGYATNPKDLMVAAFELVSYFNKGNFSTTRTSSTGESSTNPTPVLIPPHIKLMLDMHKVL